MKSDDEMLWRPDCFPIPGTLRLLMGRAPGQPTVQLTAGLHPPLKSSAAAANVKTSRSQVFPPNIILASPLYYYKLLFSVENCFTRHARLVQSWAGLAAGLADHERPSPREAFGQRGGTEALSPLCLSWHGSSEDGECPEGGAAEKRRLSSPNYERLIVKGETCGEGSGVPPPSRPPDGVQPALLRPVSDNMAAADRNLLLERRIKATELAVKHFCKQKNTKSSS